MPKRHKRDLYDDLRDALLQVPWYFGPALAVTAFIILSVISASAGRPAPTIGSQLFLSIVNVARWFVPAVVLMTWIAAEIDKLHRRRLYERQTGIDSIRALSWQEFELFIAESFRREGYEVEERGGAGADEGIDMILRKAGRKIIVQCKQYRKWKVDVRIVRELYGVMTGKRAHEAILVTTGRLTRPAEQFIEDKPITVIGSDQILARLDRPQSEAHSFQPSVPALETQHSALAPQHFLCPICGSPMVLRTARKGANAGSKFWGCSTYPRCRGTLTFS